MRRLLALALLLTTSAAASPPLSADQIQITPQGAPNCQAGKACLWNKSADGLLRWRLTDGVTDLSLGSIRVLKNGVLQTFEPGLNFSNNFTLTDTPGTSTNVSILYGTASGTSVQGNDTRLPPGFTGAGKLVYDTGSGYGETGVGTSTYILIGQGAAAPTWHAISGDATMDASGVVTLNNVGSGVVSVGDATHIPILGFNNKGLETSATQSGTALATDASVVHLAGTEVLTGKKTFPGFGASAPVLPAINGGNLNTNGHLVPNLADDTFALLNATQTLPNKTLTAPVIGNPSFTGSATTALDMGAHKVTSLATCTASADGCPKSYIDSAVTAADAFSALTSGTNTQAAMVVGTGASLAASGTATFDLSGSSGIFKTPTGASTFGGSSNTFSGAAATTLQTASGSAVGNSINLLSGSTSWDAYSTIAIDNPLSAGATTINVVSSSGFAASGTLVVDHEQITYSAISGNSFTGCTRGVNGTAATTHALATLIGAVGLPAYVFDTASKYITRGISSSVEPVYQFNVFGLKSLVLTPGGGGIEFTAYNYGDVSSPTQYLAGSFNLISHGSALSVMEFNQGLYPQTAFTIVADGSTTVTSAARLFNRGLEGLTITGAGIPGGTTISSVTNEGTMVLSAAASAGMIAATITGGHETTYVNLIPGRSPITNVTDDNLHSLGIGSGGRWKDAWIAGRILNDSSGTPGNTGTWHLDGTYQLDGFPYVNATIRAFNSPDLGGVVSTVTCGTTNNSTTVTSSAAFGSITAGKIISGTGIPANSLVVSKTDSSTIIINNAATATNASVSLTFGGAFGNVYVQNVHSTSLYGDSLTIQGAYNLTTTNTVKLLMENTTASTDGVVEQDSPVLSLIGRGWNTGSGGSDSQLQFEMKYQPVSAASASANLLFMSNKDGAGATTMATFTSGGALTLVGGLTLANTITGSTALELVSATGTTLTVHAARGAAGTNNVNAGNAGFTNVVGRAGGDSGGGTSNAGVGGDLFLHADAGGAGSSNGTGVAGPSGNVYLYNGNAGTYGNVLNSTAAYAGSLVLGLGRGGQSPNTSTPGGDAGVFLLLDPNQGASYPSLGLIARGVGQGGIGSGTASSIGGRGTDTIIGAGPAGPPAGTAEIGTLRVDTVVAGAAWGAPGKLDISTTANSQGSGPLSRNNLGGGPTGSIRIFTGDAGDSINRNGFTAIQAPGPSGGINIFIGQGGRSEIAANAAPAGNIQVLGGLGGDILSGGSGTAGKGSAIYSDAGGGGSILAGATGTPGVGGEVHLLGGAAGLVVGGTSNADAGFARLDSGAADAAGTGHSITYVANINARQLFVGSTSTMTAQAEGLWTFLRGITFSGTQIGTYSIGGTPTLASTLLLRADNSLNFGSTTAAAATLYTRSLSSPNVGGVVDLSLYAGNGTTSNTQGGSIILRVGSGGDTSTSGQNAGDAGLYYLIGYNNEVATGKGGNVLSGGGGSGKHAGQGAGVSISGGIGGTVNSGAVAGTVSGKGGNVSIDAGPAGPNNNGGAVGTAGLLNLGTVSTATSLLTIGYFGLPVTSNGLWTFDQQATFQATTNQFVLGSTNTTTINSVAPAGSRTYVIRDGLVASDFVLIPTAGAAIGDLNYRDSTTTFARLAVGGATTVLHGGTTPSYSAVSLTADVSGTLPVTSGGNGLATASVGDLRYGSGVNTLAALAGPTSATKQFLTSTGTGSAAQAPAWGTLAAGDIPSLSATYLALAGGTMTGDITLHSSTITALTTTGDNWLGMTSTKNYSTTIPAFKFANAPTNATAWSNSTKDQFQFLGGTDGTVPLFAIGTQGTEVDLRVYNPASSGTLWSYMAFTASGIFFGVPSNQTVAPDTNNAFTLGTASKSWKSMTATGNMTTLAGALESGATGGAAGQVKLWDAGTHAATVTAATHAANQTYTVADAGGSANFLMTAFVGGQTVSTALALNGAVTMGANLTTATTNTNTVGDSTHSFAHGYFRDLTSDGNTSSTTALSFNTAKDDDSAAAAWTFNNVAPSTQYATSHVFLAVRNNSNTIFSVKASSNGSALSQSNGSGSEKILLSLGSAHWDWTNNFTDNTYAYNIGTTGGSGATGGFLFESGNTTSTGSSSTGFFTIVTGRANGASGTPKTGGIQFLTGDTSNAGVGAAQIGSIAFDVGAVTGSALGGSLFFGAGQATNAATVIPSSIGIPAEVRIGPASNTTMPINLNGVVTFGGAAAMNGTLTMTADLTVHSSTATAITTTGNNYLGVTATQNDGTTPAYQFNVTPNNATAWNNTAHNIWQQNSSGQPYMSWSVSTSGTLLSIYRVDTGALTNSLNFNASGGFTFTGGTSSPGTDDAYQWGTQGKRWRLLVSTNALQSSPYAVPFNAGAPVFDHVKGSFQQITLTGNITGWTMGNGYNSLTEQQVIQFTQDGTGSRTITGTPANVVLNGTFTLSTAANAVDTLTLQWDYASTKWREVSRSMSYANGYGGTEAIGDLFAQSSATDTGRIADTATGSVLVSGGVGVVPAWSSSPTIGGTLTANTFASSGATLTGGTINNMTVGATTASTGKFTILTATDHVVLNGSIAGTSAFGGLASDGTCTSTNGVHVTSVTLSASSKIIATFSTGSANLGALYTTNRSLSGNATGSFDICSVNGSSMDSVDWVILGY